MGFLLSGKCTKLLRQEHLHVKCLCTATHAGIFQDFLFKTEATCRMAEWSPLQLDIQAVSSAKFRARGRQGGNKFNCEGWELKPLIETFRDEILFCLYYLHMASSIMNIFPNLVDHVGRHADTIPDVTGCYLYGSIYSEIYVRCPGIVVSMLYDS